MKKKYWVTFAAAMGGALASEAHRRIMKNDKSMMPYVTTSVGSILASVAADAVLPPDKPYTYGDYLDDVAKTNLA